MTAYQLEIITVAWGIRLLLCLVLLQISKQKVATLKKWLIVNNVKFKAKSSKKDDLVKLVATQIRDARELFAFSPEE